MSDTCFRFSYTDSRSSRAEFSRQRSSASGPRNRPAGADRRRVDTSGERWSGRGAAPLLYPSSHRTRPADRGKRRVRRRHVEARRRRRLRRRSVVTAAC